MVDREAILCFLSHPPQNGSIPLLKGSNYPQWERAVKTQLKDFEIIRGASVENIDNEDRAINIGVWTFLLERTSLKILRRIDTSVPGFWSSPTIMMQAILAFCRRHWAPNGALVHLLPPPQPTVQQRQTEVQQTVQQQQMAVETAAPLASASLSLQAALPSVETNNHNNNEDGNEVINNAESIRVEQRVPPKLDEATPSVGGDHSKDDSSDHPSTVPPTISATEDGDKSANDVGGSNCDDAANLADAVQSPSGNSNSVVDKNAQYQLPNGNWAIEKILRHTNGVGEEGDRTILYLVEWMGDWPPEDKWTWEEAKDISEEEKAKYWEEKKKVEGTKQEKAKSKRKASDEDMSTSKNKKAKK
jgi:hypothetical protein